VTDRHARRRRRDADPRRRPVDGYRLATTTRFDRLVQDAIAGLPDGLLGYLDDVDVLVTDVPPPDLLGPADTDGLLGRFRTATRRRPDDRGSTASLTLHRRPLEARATSRQELTDLVQDTVVQLLAEHFRLDDDRLDELGWG
jgi:predicted Zn-dependent protease with MMP-like domain